MGNVNRPDCSGVLTSSFVISLHVLQTAAHATTCLRLGHTLSLASTLWITSLSSSGGMFAQQLCSCGASALNCVSSSTIPLDLPRWWWGNFNSKLLREMFPIPPFSWNSRIKLFRGIMDGFWFDIVVLQVNSNFTSHPSPSDAFLKISTHNFSHLHKLYTVRYTLTNIHTAWLETKNSSLLTIPYYTALLNGSETPRSGNSPRNQLPGSIRSPLLNCHLSVPMHIGSPNIYSSSLLAAPRTIIKDDELQVQLLSIIVIANTATTLMGSFNAPLNLEPEIQINL